MIVLVLFGCATEVPVSDTKPGGKDSPRPEDSGNQTDSADTADTADTAEPPPAPVVAFSGDPPTNVLLISVDTTRRDQIGIYSGLDTSPNLDALLSAGVVLEDHRSCSNWTAPSMLCALTGRSPLDDDYWPTGVYDSGADPRVPVIPTGLPTLATLLRDAGYATALVTANGVLSANNTSHIVEGYDTVEIGGYAPDMNARGLNQAAQLSNTGQPWYLHLHYLDPHGPYVAPIEYSYELAELDATYDFAWDMTSSYDAYSVIAYWPYFTPEEELIAREYLFAVYRGEIRYWDENLGALMTELDRRGLLDDTLVVFMSDHGEQFGEHNEFQHGQTLFVEENRVLGGFWAKNIVSAPWSGPTLHQDLAPTVLDALGLPPNPEHTGTVIGLNPVDVPRLTFSYLVGYCDPMMSVIKDDYQLIYNWDGRKLFYDLATDPGEQSNLFDDADPKVQELWGILQPEIQGVYGRWPFMVPMDAEP